MNRPGEGVAAEKEKLIRVRSGGNYALKPDEARVEKAEHVTVKGGENLFLALFPHVSNCGTTAGP